MVFVNSFQDDLIGRNSEGHCWDGLILNVF